MNDADGAGIGGLVNSAGSGAWSGDLPNVVTTNGNLRFTQGSDNDRNSSLTNPDVTTGLYELDFKYAAVTMAGGDRNPRHTVTLDSACRREGPSVDNSTIPLEATSPFSST